MYSVVPRLSDQKYDVQLMRYNKTFSKKPIVQLEVIPEEQLLVSLTGVFLRLDFRSIISLQH